MYHTTFFECYINIQGQSDNFSEWFEKKKRNKFNFFLPELFEFLKKKKRCNFLAGIQGPVIVTQAGETVVVHFKNLASQPYSISPVGITYWKQSEGWSNRMERICLAFTHKLTHKVTLTQ